MYLMYVGYLIYYLLTTCIVPFSFTQGLPDRPLIPLARHLSSSKQFSTESLCPYTTRLHKLTSMACVKPTNCM